MLSAYAMTGDMLMTGNGSPRRKERFVVMGDWTSVDETDTETLGVEVVDAIATVMGRKELKKKANHPRLDKYRALQKAVEAGDARGPGLRVRFRILALRRRHGLVQQRQVEVGDVDQFVDRVAAHAGNVHHPVGHGRRLAARAGTAWVVWLLHKPLAA